MNSQDAELESTMLGMIDDILSGRMPFRQFAKEYNDFVTRRFPRDALRDRAEFFDDAHDGLDSVDWNARDLYQEPSEEARRTGYVTQAEYLNRLRERREPYRSKFGK